VSAVGDKHQMEAVSGGDESLPLPRFDREQLSEPISHSISLPVLLAITAARLKKEITFSNAWIY